MADEYRAIARRHVDTALEPVRVAMPNVPADGWIRTIREAIGMSRADLARRLGVSPAAITKIEESEIAGTIQLSTLRRVAECLGSDVSYAVVPAQSLDTFVSEQALARARRELTAINHTMALEGQLPASEVDDRLVEARAAELKGSLRLWSEIT